MYTVYTQTSPWSTTNLFRQNDILVVSVLNFTNITLFHQFLYTVRKIYIFSSKRAINNFLNQKIKKY